MDIYITYYYLNGWYWWNMRKKTKTQYNYKIDYLKQALIDYTQKYFHKNHVNNIKIDKAVNSH